MAFQKSISLVDYERIEDGEGARLKRIQISVFKSTYQEDTQNIPMHRFFLIVKNNSSLKIVHLQLAT